MEAIKNAFAVLFVVQVPPFEAPILLPFNDDCGCELANDVVVNVHSIVEQVW